jgi:hypothetical protein
VPQKAVARNAAVLREAQKLAFKPVQAPVDLVELLDQTLVAPARTDRALSALEIIAAYSYRFKIELAFKQALYTLGSYGYHFWMMAMTPLARCSGNQYLHRTSDDYRRLVRRKLDAYHRYVLLGCIAQGLLQYLALYFRVEVWRHFRSWLRTMNPAQPPSEAVVAQALRNTLPEFLVTDPHEHDLKKFILDQVDVERCPPLQLAS